MTDEEKRDYLDVLFDRDVALNASLKDSVFASLTAYKLELISKAPLQIDEVSSQPVRRSAGMRRRSFCLQRSELCSAC